MPAIKVVVHPVGARTIDGPGVVPPAPRAMTLKTVAASSQRTLGSVYVAADAPSIAYPFWSHVKLPTALVERTGVSPTDAASNCACAGTSGTIGCVGVVGLLGEPMSTIGEGAAGD